MLAVVAVIREGPIRLDHIATLTKHNNITLFPGTCSCRHRNNVILVSSSPVYIR
jgi:hypothetical protein